MRDREREIPAVLGGHRRMSGNRNSFQLFWPMAGGVPCVVRCLLVYSRFSRFPWAGADDFDIGEEPTIVFLALRTDSRLSNVRKRRKKIFPLL